MNLRQGIIIFLCSLLPIWGYSVNSSDSVYTLITSPVANATFTGPADIQIDASVFGIEKPYYYQVSSPDNTWRKFKIGYDPSNLWSPNQDPTAGGNDTIKITLRGVSAGIDWDDLGLRPQGSSNNVRFDTYLPTNWDTTNWTTIAIPLSDFGSATFNSISLLEIPYSYGAAAFTLDIKEIVFTGGTTDFIWFGQDKIDNSRDGVTSGNSPPGGEMVADLLQESGNLSVEKVKFYANGQLIGEDTTETYSFIWEDVLSGNFTLTAVTELSDSTTDISPSVDIVVNSGPTSDDVTITSLTDGGSYYTSNYVDIDVDVSTVAEVNYFRIENPDASIWRKFRLGYDPNNVWNPMQDPTVSGTNTHIEVTLKAISSNIEWDKIGIRPQGNDNPVRIDTYAPVGGIDTNWTTISIPLADFTGTSFSSISMIELPYSYGAGAFTIGVKEVKFVGGTEFLWYGGSKIDNSHDGVASGGTLSGAQIYADAIHQTGLTISEVAFYVNGVQVYVDSTAPYSYEYHNETEGTYQVNAVTKYSDGSQKVSDPVSIEIIEPVPGFVTAAQIFGPGTSRKNSIMRRDSLTGNIVMVWNEENPDYDVFMAILDSTYTPITPPTGYTAWPIQVNTDALMMDFKQHAVVMEVNQQTGHIAVGWISDDALGAGVDMAYHRVFDRNGNSLSAYANGELPLLQDNPNTYAITAVLAFGAGNDLYGAMVTSQNLTGTPPGRLNKINTSTGTLTLTNDILLNFPAHYRWPNIGKLRWHPQHGLLVTYEHRVVHPISGTYLQIDIQKWASDLNSSGNLLTIGDPNSWNFGLDLDFRGDHILGSWATRGDNWTNVGIKARVFQVQDTQIVDIVPTYTVQELSNQDRLHFWTQAAFAQDTNRFAITYASWRGGEVNYYLHAYALEGDTQTGYEVTTLKDQLQLFTQPQSVYRSWYRYLHRKIAYNPLKQRFLLGVEYLLSETSASVYEEDFGIKEMESLEAIIACETPPAGQLPATSFSAATPTAGHNRIISRTLRAEVDHLGEASQEDIVTSVAYFDGLGRPTQTIDVQASPTGADMVSFMQYDEFGRMPTEFLPYSASGNQGAFVGNPETDQTSFYNNAIGTFLSGTDAGNTARVLKQFEASPLNRILEQGAPGADWQPNTGSIGTQDVGEHSIVSTFRSNTSADVVLKWTQTGTTFSAKDGASADVYAAGELSVIEVLDENGHLSLTFTDKLGRTILKRVQIDPAVNNNPFQMANTYFIYDDYGQVSAVLQPEGFNQMSPSLDYTFNSDPSATGTAADYFDQYVFGYVYDERQRVIEKKVPGADWVHIVYDKLDRVVATQDGNLRVDHDWLFTKYDKLSRPVMTGIYDGSSSYTRPYLQSIIYLSTNLHEEIDGTNFAIQHGYTNQTFPTSGAEIHSVTYYDTYDFNRNGTAEDDVDFLPQAGYTGLPFDRNQGLVTGVKVLVLESSPNQWLQTVTFYDKYGRELQTQADNHLGGTDVITHEYNFAGELIKSVQQHNDATATTTIHKTYEYDHRGRLLRISQKTQLGDPVVIAEYTYNELGQQQEKNLHATDCDNFLQSVDYQYNIRGWMTHINQIDAANCGTPATGDTQTDLFGMRLHYNSDLNFGTDPADPSDDDNYNGNITALEWQSATDCEIRGYSFTYDALNRLEQAYYVRKNTSGASFPYDNAWNLDVNRYSVELSYDHNGNINTLERYGQTGVDGSNDPVFGGLMDDLSYTYKGNRLIGVEDVATTTIDIDQFINGLVTANPDPVNTNTHEYLYDANGNISEDKNKGITITYNHLNKPTLITFSSGATIAWTYSADGTKLNEQVSENTTLETERDYISGFFYETNHLTGGSRELLHFAHAEGRALKEGNVFRYEYNLTDHLGNVRLSFADIDESGDIDETTEVISEQHYYPFGSQLGGLSISTGVENRFKYNGKELHAEQGLRWYDYGARMYDPSIGRWNAVDPPAEDYASWSPYNYTVNNPIIFTDPTGEDARLIIDQDEDGNWNITIQSKIYIYGVGASEERAIQLNENKGNTFEKKSYEDEDGNKVTIGFDVTYEYAENEEDVKLEDGDNKLEFVDHNEEDSHVDGRNSISVEYDENGFFKGYVNNTGQEGMIAKKNRFNDNAAYHETLHFLGLTDRYHTLKGTSTRMTTPITEFKDDIMGQSSAGKLSHMAHFKNWGNFAKKIGENKSYILKIMVDRLNYKLITPK